MAALAMLPTSASAQSVGIEQLLIERPAVPIPRPGNQNPAVIQQSAQLAPAANRPVSTGTAANSIPAKQGSLRSGLDAIANRNINEARAIRLGMRAGSLDRKILAWAIALSAQKGVPSAEIAKIVSDLPNWPGQITMRQNSETAMAREGLSPRAVVKAFGAQKPEGLNGAVLLAKSHLALGNKKAARQAIIPYWHRRKLSKSNEELILKNVGSVLSVNDHRIRMHYLFYRGQPTAASRMASRSQQVSLARARNAVSKRLKDAGKRLGAVAPSSRRDPGYIFSRIQYLRRSDQYEKAAKLLASAPRNSDKLVYPDEWWVERRILSRAMLDIGNYKLAYKLASEYTATSATKKAEAEFHAGWYALRFLKNRRLAQKHFKKILTISKSPISQARGFYWLARASAGGQARKYYQAAAKHQGTYYGQLAAVKLGKRRLNVAASKPSAGDRARFKSRELVQAISRLESIKYGKRSESIYRNLARTLTSAGEISLLSARAEKLGKRTLALQIGKIAYRRGLPVMTSSWPIGAIPKSAIDSNTGRALAYSIARQESAFNIAAVSGANARGLLQLLPGTAKQMAKKTGIAYSFKKLTRDPAYNVKLGSAYLSEQLTNFNGSYILTFVGYNAGPGRVKQWIAKYGDPRGKPLDYVIDWVERIPFTETRNYVQRVMENMQVYKARLGRSRLEIDKDLVQGRR
ncbi:MAG: lytic transglycosylase domain-containing protein [Rhizobiaceae bacterium]|nr:lytic transglycosylase domain-containing protein [Rhizobiaceae bacterium]